MPATRLRSPIRTIELDTQPRTELRVVPDPRPQAGPFLKWVGGKGRILPQLRALMPDGKLRYAEPFFGGGAMFFTLWSEGLLDRAVLCDASLDLVVTCTAVRDEREALIATLRDHEKAYLAADEIGRSDYFYAVRERHPTEVAMTGVERAARMLFLNRTCFNGLWRENSRGRFNAPHGRYAKPAIVMEDRLHAAGLALRDAQVLHGDFRALPELVRLYGLDFVYLDPPYHPVSVTSSFNAYSGGQFSATAQRDLADVCRQLDGMGVRWLLSNSDCPLIRELYKGWDIQQVQAPRSVNSKGEGRGAVAEVAVRNYA
jgi:DNA adenine methylase